MGKVVGGQLSGAVGNMVFYSYNDTEYVRMNSAKRSKNSWSERQLLNRKRFSALAAFWRQFRYSPVKLIWQAAANGRGANCLFLSINSPAFGPDGALVDPERLHFSAGELPQVHKLKANRLSTDPQKVEVTWQYDPKSRIAHSDDELMMMVSNDGKFPGPVKTGATRKQESAVIQLPVVTGAIQGIYLFFGSEKRKMYSADIYFGI
jgi:hypothetical protein